MQFRGTTAAMSALLDKDLHVMYTKGTQDIDGKTLDGHTCNVCM